MKVQSIVKIAEVLKKNMEAEDAILKISVANLMQNMELIGKMSSLRRRSLQH